MPYPLGHGGSCDVQQSVTFKYWHMNDDLKFKTYTHTNTRAEYRENVDE